MTIARKFVVSFNAPFHFAPFHEASILVPTPCGLCCAKLASGQCHMQRNMLRLVVLCRETTGWGGIPACHKVLPRGQHVRGHLQAQGQGQGGLVNEQ